MLQTPTPIIRLFITGLIILVCALAGPHGSAKAQSHITELLEGHVVEEGLTTGDTHALKVRLTTGQYLRVVIEQSGIDLIVTALDPGGVKVVEVNSPSGPYGPEYISFVAEKQGEYLLQLRTVSGRVNSGRYSAKIQKLRIATTEDRESAAAEKTLEEGRQLLEQALNKAEPEPNKRRQEALRKFESAWSYWVKHKSRRWEVVALFNIGKTHRRLSQLKEAAEFFQKALNLTPDLEPRDWRLTASILNDSGFNYSDLGEIELALKTLRSALKMFQDKQDRRGEGSALNNLALSLFRANRARESLPYLERALQLRTEERDEAGKANILNSIASVYDGLGEPHRALDYFGRSLKIFNSMSESERARNSGTVAAVFNNRALVFHTFGDWELAIHDYEQALKVFRKLDIKSAAKTQNNLGKLYYDLGNPERALRELNVALELSSKSGDPTTQAEVLINIGEVKAAQGEISGALADFLKATALKTNDRVRASVLTSIASLKILQDEPRAALSSLEEALAIQRKIENREGEALTLQRRGEAFLKLGLKKEALEDFKLALVHSNAIAARQSKIDALYGIARVERDAGDLGSALTHSREAIDLIESQRTKVPGQQLRTAYFSTQLNQYELYIDLMMRQYRATQSQAQLVAALEASESSRARNLIDLLNEANVDLRRGVDPALLQEEREVQQKLNAKARLQMELLSSKHSKADAEKIERELNEVITEYDAVKAKIKASSPDYAQLTQPKSLSLSEIQQLLDDETVLLQYFLGNERSYLWLVSRNGISGVDSLPNRTKIESSAEAFYKLLTERTSSLNNARSRTRAKKLTAPSQPVDAAALSKMLLGPIADDIRNKRLLIVSDGVLQYLPFGALPVPSAKTPYLIQAHEIVYLPSASTLAVLRSKASSREPKPLSVAVLANPVFGADDERLKTAKQGQSSSSAVAVHNRAPNLGDGRVLRSGLDLVPLPATEREAQEINNAFQPSRRTNIVMGFDANRAMVMKLQEGGYRIVHFATHGDVNTEHPELSSIVLSLYDSAGQPQDGFLRLHDIYNLKLPAEMIVLSACSTGLGRIIKGEGLVGLTRGFMHAGSPRIVASLWRVEDLGTSELMKRFYQHMAKEGMAPSAALRQAQIEMIRHKRWNSPYHWAGFVLQGEWRPIR